MSLGVCAAMGAKSMNVAFQNDPWDLLYFVSVGWVPICLATGFQRGPSGRTEAMDIG